jgi:hypothetical protein
MVEILIGNGLKQVEEVIFMKKVTRARVLQIVYGHDDNFYLQDCSCKIYN